MYVNLKVLKEHKPPPRLTMLTTMQICLF